MTTVFAIIGFAGLALVAWLFKIITDPYTAEDR
jgi:hypothetical protein